MNDDFQGYVESAAKGFTKAHLEFYWDKLMGFILKKHLIEINIPSENDIIKKKEIVVFTLHKKQKKEDAKGKLKCGKCKIYYKFRQGYVSPKTKTTLPDAYICGNCNEKYMKTTHDKIIDIARAKWMKSEKKDNLNNQDVHSVITESSTTFFYGKFCDAFPGLREAVIWFTSQKDIVERLTKLFLDPIYFDETARNHLVSDPVWWFRDGQALFIKKFEPLKKGRVLLDVEELKIKKIAACKGSFYYKDFVYIECEADQPTKLYRYKKNEIQNMFEELGYCREEYALFKNKKITRQEYDDGSAVIKGKLQQVDGAKLRIRYLTKFNFIVAAKSSPYNCTRFDVESKKYFDGLLKEVISFNDFLAWMNTFQKHQMDY